MPHLTVEYSASLREQARMPALVRELAAVLIAEQADGKPVYPAGGVRVRALPCEDYCIADGSVAGAGFVHATLRVARGRSTETLRATGEHLFDAMKAHFGALYKEQALALSLAVEEFGPLGTWKQNNVHERLRVAQDGG